MTWKKIEVVMKATGANTEFPCIARYGFKGSEKLEVWGELYRTPAQLFHLYITSDELIQEGDWYYGIILGVETIQLCDDKEHEEELKTTKYNCKKILASSDPKLTVMAEPSGDNAWYNPTPQPSQQFIELFCKLGGKGEFEVEYEIIGDTPAFGGDLDVWGVKVNPDNTINIRQVEKKVYSRDEVISLLDKIAQDSICYDTDNFNTWIKDNLK